LVAASLVAAAIGPIAQHNAYAAGPPATIYRTQSGLVVSDSLTSGDTSGWEFNGSAVGLNAPHSASEDSGGLHLGLLAPSANNWAGYFGITPLTPAHLFHARITLGDARPVNGLLDTAVYVQQEMFQDPRIDAMGCGADVFPTETHWTISLQAGDATHEIINQSIYTDNSANQPTSRECTLITNGDNQLTAYIDGQKVFSSTNMNLNMPEPFQYYVELQTNSVTPSTGQAFTGTFTDYYATTSDSIKVINAGAGSVVRVVDATSGNVLASSTADSAGTAFVDVGRYHMPINANVIVYDSAGTNILATTATAGGMYGGDVYNVGSSTVQQTALNINSVDLAGTNPINGLYTTITRGTANVATGFTPLQYNAMQDAPYIIYVQNYGTHVFDHWDDGSRVAGRVVIPEGSAAALTAHFRETSTPASPISLTSTSQYTTKGNTPTIIGTAQPGFSIQLYDNSAAIGSAMTASATGTWSVTTPALSDGRHIFTARATDTSSASTSPLSSAMTMGIDTVPPLISVTGNTVSADGSVSLTGTASDPGSGIKAVDVQTDGAPAPFMPATQATVGDWSAWTFTTAQLAPGVHHLVSRATDLAGGQNTNSIDITVPNTAPAQSAVAVSSVDTAGATLTGLYTTLLQSGATTPTTGFTPVSFPTTSGQTYVVSVSDYGTNYFDHWHNEVTGQDIPTRDITLTAASGSLQLTAVYRHTAAPAGSAITVSGIDSAGNAINGMYTTITDGNTPRSGFTPVSFTTTGGQSYTVSISDYGTNYFDHWHNEVTGQDTLTRDVPVTAGSGTTALTAVFRHTAAPAGSAIVVNGIDLSGSAVDGMYTTITAQQDNTVRSGFTTVSFPTTSGQTYVVSVSDYGTNYFDHWHNNATGQDTANRNLTLAATTSSLQLTAVFRHTP
jgi:hypothetical protein